MSFRSWFEFGSTYRCEFRTKYLDLNVNLDHNIDLDANYDLNVNFDLSVNYDLNVNLYQKLQCEFGSK